MRKCLDDELYDIYIEDGKQIIESLREIYNKGRADATRWIPCSERLPEADAQYLCTTKFGSCTVLGFSKKPHKLDSYDFNKNQKPCFYNYDSEWGYSKVDHVIAWMPLPEPYKKQK